MLRRIIEMKAEGERVNHDYIQNNPIKLESKVSQKISSGGILISWIYLYCIKKSQPNRFLRSFRTFSFQDVYMHFHLLLLAAFHCSFSLYIAVISRSLFFFHYVVVTAGTV